MARCKKCNQYLPCVHVYFQPSARVTMGQERLPGIYKGKPEVGMAINLSST